MNLSIRIFSILGQRAEKSEIYFSDRLNITRKINFLRGKLKSFRSSALKVISVIQFSGWKEEKRWLKCFIDCFQIPATVGGRLSIINYAGYSGSGHSPRYDEPYPEECPPQRYSQSQHASESSEPLFYNSRPRHYKEYRYLTFRRALRRDTHAGSI